MDRNPPGDAIAEITGPKSGPVVAAIAISRIAVAAVAISRIAVAAVAISRLAVASVASVASVAVAAVAISRIAVAGIQPEADDLSISTVDGGQQQGTTDNPKHTELCHDRSLPVMGSLHHGNPRRLCCICRRGPGRLGRGGDLRKPPAIVFCQYLNLMPSGIPLNLAGD